MKRIYSLGIETSCDETSVAVVRDHENPTERIVKQKILSQDHTLYGGVVPELASRAHLDYLAPLVLEMFREDPRLELSDMDVICATAGPGLIGGLLVGLMMAKTLSLSLNKPFVAVNHLEAHAQTVRLTHSIQYPYLLFLISGGHCQLLEVLDLQKHNLLGQTIDDSAGEAFDKVARMLGLSYPGGPSIEKKAKDGDADRFSLPRPLKYDATANVSFSGLKTAARVLIEKIKSEQDSEQDRADLCASFQKAVAETLSASLIKGIAKTSIKHTKFVLAGGVAANVYIRAFLEKICLAQGMELVCPPLHLCTDNAAMVAWVGLECAKRGIYSLLGTIPKPRWPLV